MGSLLYILACLLLCFPSMFEIPEVSEREIQYDRKRDDCKNVPAQDIKSTKPHPERWFTNVYPAPKSHCIHTESSCPLNATCGIIYDFSQTGRRGRGR